LLLAGDQEPALSSTRRLTPKRLHIAFPSNRVLIFMAFTCTSVPLLPCAQSNGDGDWTRQRRGALRVVRINGAGCPRAARIQLINSEWLTFWCAAYPEDLFSCIHSYTVDIACVLLRIPLHVSGLCRETMTKPWSTRDMRGPQNLLDLRR
jgi:hypothetical protein